MKRWDKLVCWLRNEAIQKCLLSEKNLTFQEAVETTHTMELVAKNTAEFTGQISSEASQVHGIGITWNKGGMKVQPSNRVADGHETTREGRMSSMWRKA